MMTAVIAGNVGGWLKLFTERFNFENPGSNTGVFCFCIERG